MTSTNVVLNMAISPTLWLIPNNLIILDKPIVGYNNKLKVSNNYYGVANNQPKKVHQKTPTHHLETLNDNTPHEKKEKTEIIKQKSDNHNNELMAVLTVTGIKTYLLTKYMI